MRAVLVEISDDRRIGSMPILDENLVLGRDAEVADLVFPHPRVSRQHARLERTDDGHVLTDLGSSNGTRLNGEELLQPTLLEPGDCIELGDAITVYYESGLSSRVWIAAGGGVLAVVALLLVILWPDTDPVWGHAERLAQEGLAAYRDSRPRDARRSLDEAFEALYYDGRLDDIPRLRAREEGLRRLGASLAGNVDLVRIYQQALEDSRRRRARTEVAHVGARGPCRLERVSRSDLNACVREHAEKVLYDLWQDPARIPESFYVAVRDQLTALSTRRRSWVEQSLKRGDRLDAMMRARLEESKVPPMLRYLAMIESGYQPAIRSRAGARGLWQFMPATARAYGLKVADGIDERTDPKKATRAAARYLRDLAFEFGGDAMLLAIASYNKGENGVRRALKKLDDPRKDRSYWTLVEHDLLPKETQEYVPRLIAAAVLGEAGLPPVDILDSH